MGILPRRPVISDGFPALGFTEPCLKDNVIKGGLKKFTMSASLHSFQIIFLCCYIYITVKL